MKRSTLGMLAAATAIFSAGYDAAQTAPKPPTNDWLLEAPDDTERFRRLQQYLRGFDQPMWEVGYRWQGVHDALNRDNYDLAIYHWDKIKTTIEMGYLKRPARRANADAILINSGVHAAVKAGFETRDRAKAWAAFTTARTACMSCHDAEKMPFMNNQAIIQNLLPPGK